MQFILITSMIIKLTAVRVSIFIHFYYRTVEKKMHNDLFASKNLINASDERQAFIHDSS